MLVAALLGAVIGLLLGLLGGGGSILAVPALVYGVGLPLHEAVPTSLVVVGLSSLTAVLTRWLQVQWRIAAVIGIVGAAAAFGGAAVNRLLEPRWVLIGFAVLMAAAGVRMLSGDGAENDVSCSTGGSRINWRRCLPRSIAVGVAVGFLTGLFGVGGGFLLIPALVLGLGLPMTTAVPTSLVVVAVNAAAGFAAHAGDAQLDWMVVGVFTGAAIVGSLVAGKLAHLVPADRLRRWFAFLVLAIAAFVVIQTLVNPGAVTGR